MLDYEEIKQTVKQLIRQLAEEQSIAIPEVIDNHTIVEDLGFTSLDVATLAALLEVAFKVDPFAMDMAVITEIRTVEDIAKVYHRCLNGTNTLDPQIEEDDLQSRGQARRQAIFLNQSKK